MISGAVQIHLTPPMHRSEAEWLDDIEAGRAPRARGPKALTKRQVILFFQLLFLIFPSLVHLQQAMLHGPSAPLSPPVPTSVI